MPLSRQKPLIVVEEIVCVFEAQEQMEKWAITETWKSWQAGRLRSRVQNSRKARHKGSKSM